VLPASADPAFPRFFNFNLSFKSSSAPRPAGYPKFFNFSLNFNLSCREGRFAFREPVNLGVRRSHDMTIRRNFAFQFPLP